jgi:methionyl-tRNA formyltransferase
MINVHASVLPRYRGAAPIQRAVLAGDEETGVTIMQVVSELDAGPMLAVTTVPIAPDATSGDVEAVVAAAGAPLLIGVVDRLSEGSVIGIPQDPALATFAPKVTKDEGAIDWNRPARDVHNRVRGLQPWPLASTHLDGKRYVIRRTAVDEGTTDRAPGTIVDAHGDRLAVAAGGGTIVRILEVQPEGRRSMAARDFLAGHHLLPGARFDT